MTFETVNVEVYVEVPEGAGDSYALDAVKGAMESDERIKLVYAARKQLLVDAV